MHVRAGTRTHTLLGGMREQHARRTSFVAIDLRIHGGTTSASGCISGGGAPVMKAGLDSLALGWLETEPPYVDDWRFERSQSVISALRCMLELVFESTKVSW